LELVGGGIAVLDIRLSLAPARWFTERIDYSCAPFDSVLPRR